MTNTGIAKDAIMTSAKAVLILQRSSVEAATNLWAGESFLIQMESLGVTFVTTSSCAIQFIIIVITVSLTCVQVASKNEDKAKQVEHAVKANF
mmetsp:Transcript_3224/g.7107  ORF Transcript_3224/g.7107 Transcript_3224/m.7107 type:complete len:93 (+) Transcript_3224:245-523(+)